MNSITLLDAHTINKIAAGEVVERPGSVVKELIENAIDAGSSTISVEIRDGGSSMIRILDNGHGIAREQVKNAFLSHATSKITRIDDLETVLTMGFRGEALASIAAVAKVELITKTKEEIEGTKIVIHGGNIVSFEPAGCSDGTCITVNHLFYNIPARKKFLKKTSAESGFISDIVSRLAMGNPEIAFQFKNNETTILQTTGNNDLLAAVFHVYGKDVASKLLQLDFKQDDYQLKGLLGKPELYRSNRNYGNLFINKRFVKNKIITAAVEDAYKSRLLIGKFPVYILNLAISPNCVDVNVHPAKLEVHFHDDNKIYQFVFKAITKCFENKILIPESSWDSKPSAQTNRFLSDIASLHNQQPQAQELDIHTVITEIKKPIKRQESIQDNLVHPTTINKLLSNQETIKGQVQEEKGKLFETNRTTKNENKLFRLPLEEPHVLEEEDIKNEIPFFHNFQIIGQVFHTYWVVEQGDSLFMIDQHAAHERVLYEDLLNKLAHEKVYSQRFLQPLVMQLTYQEIQTLEEHLDSIQQLGFDVEVLGENSYALRGAPYIFKNPASPHFFVEIIDLLTDGFSSSWKESKLKQIASIACKAAVKGNDKLSFQEAKKLIERLLVLQNPFTCPHGRPTIIELTKYELEKKFKRIQN